MFHIYITAHSYYSTQSLNFGSGYGGRRHEHQDTRQLFGERFGGIWFVVSCPFIIIKDAMYASLQFNSDCYLQAMMSLTCHAKNEIPRILARQPFRAAAMTGESIVTSIYYPLGFGAHLWLPARPYEIHFGKTGYNSNPSLFTLPHVHRCYLGSEYFNQLSWFIVVSYAVWMARQTAMFADMGNNIACLLFRLICWLHWIALTLQM